MPLRNAAPATVPCHDPCQTGCSEIEFGRLAETYLQGDMAFSGGWLSGHSDNGGAGQSSMAPVEPVSTLQPSCSRLVHSYHITTAGLIGLANALS